MKRFISFLPLALLLLFAKGCTQPTLHLPANCQKQQDCQQGQVCQKGICQNASIEIHHREPTPEAQSEQRPEFHFQDEQTDGSEEVESEQVDFHEAGMIPSEEEDPTEQTEELEPIEKWTKEPEASETHPEPSPEHHVEQRPEPPPCKPTNPSKEICDGKDNDCNGQIDENLFIPCYPKLPGCKKRSDGTYACIGRCKIGKQVCITGKWSHCQGAIIPASADHCINKIDDDCDGKVDEDCNNCSPEKINHNYAQMGTNASIEELVFSQDGKRMVSCCHNNSSLKIWDGQGKLLKIVSLKNPVNRFSFSIDNKYLIAHGSAGLRYWDTSTGKELSLTGYSLPSKVKLEPRAQWNVSWGYSEVSIYNTRTQKRHKTIKLKASPENHVLSPDGKTLALTFYDHSIQLWNPTTGKLLRTISPGHVTGHVKGVGSGKSCNIRNRSCPTGELCVSNKCLKMDKKTGHTAKIQTGTFSQDNKYLITSGLGYYIYIWEVQSGKLYRSLQTSTWSIDQLALGPNSKVMALVTQVNYVDTLEFRAFPSGKLLHKTPKLSQVKGLAFHPNGKQVLTSSEDKTILTWSVDSGKIIKKQLPRPTHFRDIQHVEFSPDGKVLATAAEDLKFWEVKTGKFLRSIPISGIYHLTFSPDSKSIIVASRGNYDKWDVKTGKRITRFKQVGNSNPTFHPMTQWLMMASGYYNRAIYKEQLKIWDLPSGKLIQTITSPTATSHRSPHLPLAELHFGRGGDYVVSRGRLGIHYYDGIKLQIWDLNKGKLTSSLGHYSHAGYADKQLAFSADGKYMASAFGGHARDGHSIPLTLRRIEFRTLKHTVIPIQNVLTRYTNYPLDFAPGTQIIALAVPGSTYGNKYKAAIRFYSFTTGKVIRELNEKDVSHLAFSPNSKILAVCYNKRTIKLWTCKP